MAADKQHNRIIEALLFTKSVWPVNWSTTSSLRLIPLLLFVIFSYPRLYQDIHRVVSHYGMHGSCTYGDGDNLLCDSSCAECDFSFFMFPEQVAEPIHCFLPISLSVCNVVELGLKPSIIYGINHLRGPPCYLV